MRHSTDCRPESNRVALNRSGLVFQLTTGATVAQTSPAGITDGEN